MVVYAFPLPAQKTEFKGPLSHGRDRLWEQGLCCRDSQNVQSHCQLRIDYLVGSRVRSHPTTSYSKDFGFDHRSARVCAAFATVTDTNTLCRLAVLAPNQPGSALENSCKDLQSGIAASSTRPIRHRSLFVLLFPANDIWGTFSIPANMGVRLLLLLAPFSGRCSDSAMVLCSHVASCRIFDPLGIELKSMCVSRAGHSRSGTNGSWLISGSSCHYVRA